MAISYFPLECRKEGWCDGNTAASPIAAKLKGNAAMSVEFSELK